MKKIVNLEIAFVSRGGWKMVITAYFFRI